MFCKKSIFESVESVLQIKGAISITLLSILVSIRAVLIESFWQENLM